MEGEKRDRTQRILKLTLRIIYLLTGEDYGPIKKEIADHVTSSSHPCVSGGRRRGQSPIIKPPPPSLTTEKGNEQKILEVTNQIIELLTGEVPIRCQDVAAYLSMEEQEYLEGRNERYKVAMMEDQKSLTSPGGSKKRNPRKRRPRPLYSQNSAQENRSTPQEDQHEQILPEAFADMAEEMPDIKIKEEELSPEHSTDSSYTKNDMETLTFISKDGDYITEDYHGEDSMIHSADLSPSTHARWFPDHSPPAFEHNADPVAKMFQCSACGKYFAQKAGLLAHQKSHTSDDLLSCGSALSVVQRDHVNRSRKVPFSCSVCGECFANKAELVEHKSCHARVKPYACSKCGKCFTQKGRLLSHERTHVAQRPFSCSECGKSFFQRGHLLSHERTHATQKEFPCSKCGKCYTKKSSLKTHEKLHMGLKPYICSDCGKCFTRKTLLTLHERVHTGEKPYSCAECGRCFSQRPHLISHKRTHLGKSR